MAENARQLRVKYKPVERLRESGVINRPSPSVHDQCCHIAVKKEYCLPLHYYTQEILLHATPSKQLDYSRSNTTPPCNCWIIPLTKLHGPKLKND